MGRPVLPSGDGNNVPVMSIYGSPGNLNAGEEIIWPEKKFHRLRQKMVHIAAFIG